MSTIPRMSRHAEIRAQQRGIRARVRELILVHHDHARPLGGGCRSIFISRRRAARLRANGLEPALLEAAIGVVLVVSADGRRVVTVLHASGARARRYRKGVHGARGASALPCASRPTGQGA